MSVDENVLLFTFFYLFDLNYVTFMDHVVLPVKLLQCDKGMQDEVISKVFVWLHF